MGRESEGNGVAILKPTFRAAWFSLGIGLILVHTPAELKFSEAVRTGSDSLSRPSGIALIPNGLYLFSLPGNRDSVDCYARDPESGHLTWKSASQVKVNPSPDSLVPHQAVSERHAVFSRDGRSLYEGRPYDYAWAAYAVDPLEGTVNLADAVSYWSNEERHRFTDVFLARGDTTVMVSDMLDSSFASWRIERSTGKITTMTSYARSDSGNGYMGLTARSGLVGSRDERFLYAASGRDGSVSVFAWLPEDGLEWRQSGKPPLPDSGDADSLAFIALSPDGRQLYTATRHGHAVHTFDRDTVTGLIHYRETLIPDSTATPSLAGISDMAMSPDGSAIFLSAETFHALTVLKRDSTGALSFFKSFRNGVGGVAGVTLGGPLAVSPEGRHVYVASREDASIAVFEDSAIAPRTGIRKKEALLRHAAARLIRCPGVNRLLVKGMDSGAYRMVVSSLGGRKIAEVAGIASGGGEEALGFPIPADQGLCVVEVRQKEDAWRQIILPF